MCQLFGCALLLVFGASRGFARILAVCGGLALTVSFGVNGHSASVNLPSGAIAAAHVGAAAWWLASLLLLRHACSSYLPNDLQTLVTLFSKQAMVVVGCLLAAGVVLILTLIDFSRAVWLSSYAQILAGKLSLAAMTLLLAAFNKMRLTPRLATSGRNAAVALQNSITIEIVFIAGILSATAILTTYASPHT